MSTPFHASTRADRLERVEDEPFDLVVVGGGITGAGVARDAAMRGLRVALLEKGDLASGTSSASSKLVHGGLRYLAQGNLSLVFESVSERARLGVLAPHLVRPAPFLIPVWRKAPTRLFLVVLALWIYELLALFRVPRLHSTHRGRRALQVVPELQEDGLDGAVLFWDCATDDARLVLETARSAHDAGAWVLPRVAVTGFLSERSHVTGVTARDELTGKVVEVRGKVVVNATGPWTDRTLGLRRQRSRLLRPTKGSHIVLSAERLPLAATVMLPAADGRTVFAIPSGERVFVGTTDTDYEGDYDRVRVTSEETDWFLSVLNHRFPRATLTRDDVLGSWAGLRPLLRSDGGERDIPRDHAVVEDDDGLVTVAGGKLTTYRLMAQEVVELAARRLRAEGLHVGRCPTGAVLLPGGQGVTRRTGRLVTTLPDGAALEEEARERFGEEVLLHLLETYGGRWVEVAARTDEHAGLGERIDPELPYLWAEVDHAVFEELALTLEDVMRRRTQLQLRARDRGRGVAPRVAARMATLLGWSDQETQRQLARWSALVTDQESWRSA